MKYIILAVIVIVITIIIMFRDKDKWSALPWPVNYKEPTIIERQQ